jgi:hypothetical protein
MLDILAYTMLRLGDASRFGPPHLRKMIKQMAFQIATEKGRGRTIVTVPIHSRLRREFEGSTHGRDHRRGGVRRKANRWRRGPIVALALHSTAVRLAA